MHDSLSQIDRLRLAAKAYTDDRLFAVARVILAVVTPFLVLLAFGSAAPRRETVLVSLVAGCACVTMLLLWSKWRYKGYVLAAFCLSFVVADLLLQDHRKTHTILGWIADHSFPLVFIYYTCAAVVIGKRYARANSSELQGERQQIKEWVERIKSAPRSELVEFPSGSFWTGYWTYRILKTGSHWFVAKFKKGTSKVAELRVQSVDELAIRQNERGTWDIEVSDKGKKKIFPNVDVPSGIFARS